VQWTLGFNALLLLSAVVLWSLVGQLDAQHDQVRQSQAIEQSLREVLGTSSAKLIFPAS
jgi:hypothetical protein